MTENQDQAEPEFVYHVAWVDEHRFGDVVQYIARCHQCDLVQGVFYSPASAIRAGDAHIAEVNGAEEERQAAEDAERAALQAEFMQEG